MKPNEIKLSHHKSGVDIYKDKNNAYYVKKGEQFFRLSIPPTTLEPPNTNRPEIVALYQNTKTKEYYDATPWTTAATFKLEGYKIRGHLKDDGRYYILTINISRKVNAVDKRGKTSKISKHRKTFKISASKMLNCLEDNWIYENGKYYITLNTICDFVHAFAERYAIKYLKIPYQMSLPLYEPVKQTTFGHQTLEIL